MPKTTICRAKSFGWVKSKEMNTGSVYLFIRFEGDFTMSTEVYPRSLVLTHTETQRHTQHTYIDTNTHQRTQKHRNI